MRVSTEIQTEVFSLDAQREKILGYAQYQDIQLVEEFCDAGRSGKNVTGRPEFQRMMAKIQSGKDPVDFVLVFKLSRFGRNAADVLSNLQTIQDFGTNLICVDDNIDSSKDSGKLMIAVLSAVAEIERENILSSRWQDAGRKHGKDAGTAGRHLTDIPLIRKRAYWL